MIVGLLLRWPLELSAATSARATTNRIDDFDVRAWLREEVGITGRTLKFALDVCKVKDIEGPKDLFNMHNDGTLAAAGFAAVALSKTNITAQQFVAG